MSKIAQRLKRLVQGMEDRHDFKLESAILKFTHLVRERMNALGIGTTDLANRIDVKPPYVSKVMRGESNFTLDTMIKLCTAIDADFDFNIIPKGKQQVFTSETVHIDAPVLERPWGCYEGATFVAHPHTRSNPPMVKFSVYG